MDVPEHIAPFWSSFLMETARGAETPLYDVSYFGDREAAASVL